MLLLVVSTNVQSTFLRLETFPIATSLLFLELEVTTTLQLAAAGREANAKNLSQFVRRYDKSKQTTQDVRTQLERTRTSVDELSHLREISEEPNHFRSAQTFERSPRSMVVHGGQDLTPGAQKRRRPNADPADFEILRR